MRRLPVKLALPTGLDAMIYVVAYSKYADRSIIISDVFVKVCMMLPVVAVGMGAVSVTRTMRYASEDPLSLDPAIVMSYVVFL